MSKVLRSVCATLSVLHMLLTLKIAHKMLSITVFLQPAFIFIAASRFLTNLPKTSLSALVRMVWPQTTGNLTNSGLNYQISTAYLTRYLGVSRPRIDSTVQERLKDPDFLSLPTLLSSVCERSFLMGPALLLKLEAPHPSLHNGTHIVRSARGTGYKWR